MAGNETVDGSLWTGANNIDIAGTVNGDVFCGGQTVNISGTVKGDVICGAQTITISGHVEGNVRIGAQTVNLTGIIDRNASVGAQTINTDSKSQIGGDASLGATNITLNGKVGRDLAVAGTSVTLSGEVGRDIKSGIDKMSLLSGAKVGGSVDYTSNNKIDIASGVMVSGALTQHQPKQSQRQLVHLMIFGGVMALLAGLILLLTALVITALAPRLVHSVAGQAIQRPWVALLTGFVASIVVPILAVLLMITVVGIPLGILMLVSWIVIAMASGLFSAYYIGRRIWSSQGNPLLRVLLGGVILLILLMVPVLGFFVMLAAFWLGAGMVLLEVKNRRPSPKYQLK